MHTFIDFPNLGIHLENVGKTVTVFGFDIAYYGITIAVGMLAGILVATQVAKRTGQKQEDSYRKVGDTWIQDTPSTVCT